MAVYTWSQTAGSNANADATINWAEGQAPSTINDSARAMMAAIAKYRDDIAGAIVTGGTSTAYTVTSNSGFDTLAHLNGQLIAFSPHTNNGATVTLNVDGLGAKPLRLAPNVELQTGSLVQGTPYFAVYNNSDGAFYLQGASNSAYTIPLGGGLDYWGATAPNSAFAFPYGQAISRTTYASLFALFGTTYGSGDGTTTFNLPDKRGRVSACLDNMGGSDASRLSDTHCSLAAGRTTLGYAAGEGAHPLAAGEIPTITSNGTNTISVSSTGQIPSTSGTITFTSFSGGSASSIPYQANGNSWSANNSMSGSNNISVTSNNTGNASHNNAQPTILCNYIMRII